MKRKLTPEEFQAAMLVLNERKNYREFFSKYLKIRDRETSEIIPFVPNKSQQKLLNIVEGWEKKYPDDKTRPTLYVIILKARRQGFSTCTEALFFTRLIREKHKTGMIISFDDDSATNISDMSNIFYQYLPQELKPERRPAHGKGLFLENNKFDSRIPISDTNNPGLQSKFLIDTARNMNAGSSYNIHYLHLSELAKYPGDVKVMMTSILQAVPSFNSIVIVESTALGFNYFKDLWDDSISGKNDYIPLFIPWFEDEGSHMPYDGFVLTEEEEKIKALYNLSNAQLQWRRWAIKNKCGGDIGQYRQEYPASPEEAFLSTGKPVFDNESVNNRLQNLKKIYETIPYIQCRLKYTYDASVRKIKDDTIKLIPDKAGNVRLYEMPKHGYPYVIGGDIAEGGADYSSGQCINNVNGLQAAVWHGQCDTDTYAREMYALGKLYNDALIGIETNFDTHPVKELEGLGYWHQYKREIIDSTTNEKQDKHGFRTTTITRPVIIDDLKAVVRESIELVNDIPTLHEMLTFVRNPLTNKPEAQSGKHDDLILALAIAYHVRGQMWTTIDEDSLQDGNREYDDEDSENQKSKSWFN